MALQIDDPAGYLYRNFYRWVTSDHMRSMPELSFRPCHDDPEWCLLDLVHAWLKYGNGASRCGSYDVYSLVLSRIVAEWSDQDVRWFDRSEEEGDRRPGFPWDLEYPYAVAPQNHNDDNDISTRYNVWVTRVMLPFDHSSGHGQYRHPAVDAANFYAWKFRAEDEGISRALLDKPLRYVPEIASLSDMYRD